MSSLRLHTREGASGGTTQQGVQTVVAHSQLASARCQIVSQLQSEKQRQSMMSWTMQDDDGDIIHSSQCLRATEATSESVWANRVQCISDGASGGSVYTRLVAAMNPYPSQVAQQRDCRLPFADLG